jgi:hypothetical protein
MLTRISADDVCLVDKRRFVCFYSIGHLMLISSSSGGRGVGKEKSELLGYE